MQRHSIYISPWISGKVSLILILMFLNLLSFCQLPVITTRFANPAFADENKIYCLDVEFQSDTPGQILYGMNVRFFYNDSVLEFNSFENFTEGYGPMSPYPPKVTNGNRFLQDDRISADYVNGAIQLFAPIALPISTDGWTRIFSVCFTVDDTMYFQDHQAVPELIWDLKDETKGSFLPGSEGMVITLTDDSDRKIKPATEKVIHSFQ